MMLAMRPSSSARLRTLVRSIAKRFAGTIVASNSDASAEVVRNAWIVHRATVLCVLRMALLFLSVFVPHSAHTGVAYSKLLFTTVLSSRLLFCVRPPTSGMSLPIDRAASSAFLEAAAI